MFGNVNYISYWHTTAKYRNNWLKKKNLQLKILVAYDFCIVLY